MAFTTSAHEFADRAATQEALSVLHLFMAGQEKARDTQDALICLVILHGEAMKAPARQFWRAMRIEDEAAQDCLCMEALRRIERHFDRRHANN